MSETTHHVVVYLFRVGKTQILFHVDPWLMETEEEMDRAVTLIVAQFSDEVDIVLGEEIVLARIILNEKPYVVLMWTSAVDVELIQMIQMTFQNYNGRPCSDGEIKHLLSEDTMRQLREHIFSIRKHGAIN
ncbi:MAG: hypothetical protein G01um101466_22 [Parcubacteria group bacterium Gr01-1014_66]|nr:MAG: hypothetical protein G01um101466_22 [Parcubacteria group bacterium Gr01-1014_66]